MSIDHTQPANDRARIEALRSYGVLDTPREPSFDDLALLAKVICGTRYAVVNLVDADRQWFKAEIGFGVRELPLDDSICARVMLEPGLVEIPDLCLDRRFDCNPLVTAGPGLRFYAGAPLINEDGHVLGTLCVLDNEPRRLEETQRQALAALGRQVVSQMELRRHGELSRQRAQELTDAIARRDLAEIEGRRSEASYRFIIDRVLAGVVVHDAQGAIVFSNPMASDLLGLSSEQLQGRTPADPGWHFVDEHGEVMAGADYPASIVMRSREPLQGYVVGVVRHAGAEPAWALVNAYPDLDEAGDLNRVIVSFIDITARREVNQRLAETAERLKFTLDAAEIGDWDLDLVNDVATRSLRHDQCFGYSEPLEEWGFEVFQRHLHPDDREYVTRQFQESLEQLKDWHFECRVIWPDGSIHWIAAHGSIYHHENRPTRMSGIVFDITERKLAEARMKAADRRKDEFLAMLAHELRNPLAPISTSAQLLQLAAGDEQRVRKASEVITRQVGHMTRLVDDLLDVSRVTRGQVQLEMEPLELKSVIGSAIEQVRPLIEARRHVLTTWTGADPLPVIGDRTRLVQVIANLLNNAAKYTPSGGRIDLRIAAQGDRVQARVSDNGSGIDRELLPHIFELFTQGERTPDRSQGGLGIGLALVRSIAQLHGGTVEASSDGPGAGSTFTVTLPLAAASTRSAAAPDRAAPDSIRAPMQILVVDDNADAATSLAEVLRLQGHSVAVAEDAAAALDRDSEGTDVFILDIGLPDMTGHELAGRLRARIGARPVLFIALTGYGRAHDRELSRAAGFDHHLVKPVDAHELTRILDQAAELNAKLRSAARAAATRS